MNPAGAAAIACRLGEIDDTGREPRLRSCGRRAGPVSAVNRTGSASRAGFTPKTPRRDKPGGGAVGASHAIPTTPPTERFHDPPPEGADIEQSVDKSPSRAIRLAPNRL